MSNHRNARVVSRQVSIAPSPSQQSVAAVYTRVSTEEQKKGFSLGIQREACLAYAQQHGYAVPETYCFEDDDSGARLDRPALGQLRDLIHASQIQAVIVSDLDRLARKLAYQLLLKDECEQAGILFHDVSRPDDDDSPESQMLSNVRGVFAEYERLKILERTAGGLQARAKAGHTPGGAVALGYRYISGHKEGHYEIDEEEAEIVRRIFRMCVHDGLSLSAIARQLTAERILTAQDRRSTGPKRRSSAPGIWFFSSIADILHNETYTGTMHYGKKKLHPAPSASAHKTSRKKTARETWTAIAVPPIIDQAVFDAAQEQMKRNAKNSPRNRKHTYLLSNARLRCGHCRAVMRGQYNASRDRRVYRCSRLVYLTGKPCCGSVKASQVEADVWAGVCKIIHNPALIASQVAYRKRHAGQQQSTLERERQSFLRQITQCEKELKKWEHAYTEDIIDDEDFKTKRTEIAHRRMSAEQEIVRIDTEQQLLEQAEIEIGFLEDYCKRLRRNMGRSTIEEKQRIIDGLHLTAYWERDKSVVLRGTILDCFDSGVPRYAGIKIPFLLAV